MNLKERGITVGDLLIIFIVIVTSTLFLKAYNKDKQTTFIKGRQEKLFYSEILLPKNQPYTFTFST